MKVTMTGDGLAQSAKTIKPLDVFKYQGKTMMAASDIHSTSRDRYAINTTSGLIDVIPLTAIVRKIGTMEIIAE